MNNPNHPLYNALGGSSNLHLLDNMLFTTDQGKQNVIQQYTYPMETLAAHQVSKDQKILDILASQLVALVILLVKS